jgi:hypothetical protein
VDLTQSTGLSAPDASVLPLLGDAARAVPFQAILDEQGRILSLLIGLDATGKPLSTITISDYGTSVAVTKPVPTEVIKAPASVYGVFNNR